MTASEKKSVLVIGASGIVGGAHVTRLAGRGDLDIVALSRTPPVTTAANVRHLPLDLTAPATDDLSPLRRVTHAVYTAYTDAPGWESQQAPNRQLFAAALGLIQRACPALRHVTLIQGMKAYGSHLGPFKTPARESDPRIPQGHFYYDQQDALADAAARRGWDWTALRPHVVIGPARRSPQNLIVVLAVYASLLKAQDRPLAFPGPEAAFDAVYQATDAELLSRAIEWAGDCAAAWGEAFNITNGDFFRWRHVWPRIAALFDMAAAGPQPTRLVEAMSEAGPLWNRLVQTQGLEANPLERLVSWPFADYVFGTTWDVMAHTHKCRAAGFLEFIDSEQMLLDRLAELRRLKIVP